MNDLISTYQRLRFEYLIKNIGFRYNDKEDRYDIVIAVPWSHHMTPVGPIEFYNVFVHKYKEIYSKDPHVHRIPENLVVNIGGHIINGSQKTVTWVYGSKLDKTRSFRPGNIKCA